MSGKGTSIKRELTGVRGFEDEESDAVDGGGREV